MLTDLVLRQLDGPIARLTLNDPGRANVLSEAMIAALGKALAAAGADPAVRVIVLGAAGKIFCAGHELGELRAGDDKAGHEALFARCSALMLAIGASPKPVIAKVQGAAVAAGCQLVASCDLAYAAETARFAVSGINLGLFCSTPSVALSRNVPRKAALEMLLTGRFVAAAEAAVIGLINRAVPAADLDRVVDEVAAAIAGKSPQVIALGKALFRRQIEAPVEGAYA
ncbi:MAG: enoyl-CoA hydratase, partial [Pseudomonadota bacterium]|nr:enoyl-CoA hydratase [Pseudomonadota bacterium]